MDEKTPVGKHAELIKHVVKLANAFLDKADGSFEQVQDVLDKNEIVFAVWNDAKSPEGVGYTIVKGQQLIRENAASGESRTCKVGAIPCIDGDQAEELLNIAGEKDVRH
jgi:hypothetical protein